ncbi:MAG: cobalt-precorrin-5B (C(1))-methyltransferase CbiD [Eubacterium sp.]|nr:cobalt-precorrin-5B (C(1))-methyltransferase CbiD [Eubacterium sp.]
MKSGFTTGSCAAAASKAAAYMLLSGEEKLNIDIMTPKGVNFHADILEISIEKDRVSCAVKKYSGDDPDITNGTLIFSEVSFCKESGEVIIDGGKGVGRVTKPGLDQPVGNAAINSVPRKMITDALKEVMDAFDYEGGLKVKIYIPEGEELAKKTFNPKLGIVGGLSVIGTSGVVEPMSEKALTHTIFIELRQKRALGQTLALVTPGNYGRDFMSKEYGFTEDMSVKCSDFVGDTLDMIKELGFEKLLFVGHIGKLSKVALGVMNTHSKYGDGRMEAILSCTENLKEEEKAEILNVATTEEAVNILDRYGIRDMVMNSLLEKINLNITNRLGAECKAETVMYSRQHGLLAETAGAKDAIEQLKRLQEG